MVLVVFHTIEGGVSWGGAAHLVVDETPFEVFMGAFDPGFEVVVVDDGSVDRTSAVAAEHD